MPLDSVYTEGVPDPPTPGSRAGDGAYLAWEVAVEGGLISPEGMRFALWIRGAPTLHHGVVIRHWCPMCTAPCSDWGSHLWHSCPVVVGCALRGLRGLAVALVAAGRRVQWDSLTRLRVSGASGRTGLWELCRDNHVRRDLEEPDAIVTWSGLLWAPGLSVARSLPLMQAYLSRPWVALRLHASPRRPAVSLGFSAALRLLVFFPVSSPWRCPPASFPPSACTPPYTVPGPPLQRACPGPPAMLPDGGAPSPLSSAGRR